MSYSPNTLTTFPIPLGIRAHQQAQQFRSHHPDPQKAKQVYLNTLAVIAVQDYLAMMGYHSDLSQSDSHQPIQQTLMDCADLMVPDYGRLECRYCLETDSTVSIPPEVWDNRLGFIIVQLSTSLREAHILGLLPSVAQDRIALDAIAPLDTLSQLLQTPSPAPSPTPDITIQLQNWFQSLQDSWQTIQQSLDFFLSSSDLALNYRSQSPSQDNGTPDLCRTKNITLTDPQAPLNLSVFMGLKALPNRETEVWVKVKAQSPGQLLPPALNMKILTPPNQEIMAAQSNGTEAMQFRFSAGSGEQFRLQITLNTLTWQEDFEL